MNETIHGNRKRIEYLSDLISRLNPQSVLDVGCGNGVFLTIPLAERFPSVQFIGIDSDAETIALANATNSCSNLSFLCNDQLSSDKQYDLVIASEVIEHVDEPDAFLLWLKTVVKKDGKLVITTPNGYGPFEIVTFVETLLDLSGVLKVLAKLPGMKKLKVGDSYTSNDVRSMQHDTLAISPHVNFFSLGVLKKLFSRCGFRVIEYRARSFVGGLGFNQLMRSEKILTWNSRVSDSLSARLVSGWMFVLEPRELELNGSIKSGRGYSRRLNEKLRRRLTAKRWGTEDQL